MTPPSSKLVSLLVFEAADCLMALPASEVTQLEEKRGRESFSSESRENDSRPRLDLEEYFTQRTTDGPWLQWTRGARQVWLRVRRVIDVVPVSLTGLKPLPKILRGQKRTEVFLAAGVRGDDVFLLLDPARLRMHESQYVGSGFGRTVTP